MEARADSVEYDVLLKSPASGKLPSLDTIAGFRPSPEVIERCRRWFASRGVTAHPTDFGLACSAPRPVFESLFKVKLRALEKRPGAARFEMLGDPVVPADIAAVVEQVTITASPELF